MSKVLYVDDNDDNVYMLKMRLELLGDFEVITAEDGEKGCEMVCTERPDIVLMDLEMPGISGWEAAKRIKSNPETRDIPVLALSAHALAGEREKALAAGCDEFDTKPVEFDRLVAKLRRLLASKIDAPARAGDATEQAGTIAGPLLPSKADVRANVSIGQRFDGDPKVSEPRFLNVEDRERPVAPRH